MLAFRKFIGYYAVLFFHIDGVLCGIMALACLKMLGLALEITEDDVFWSTAFGFGTLAYIAGVIIFNDAHAEALRLRMKWELESNFWVSCTVRSPMLPPPNSAPRSRAHLRVLH